MIAINSLDSLRHFGIVFLTGEADNLGFRVLCDLTERGRKIVAEALGIKQDGFLPNVNDCSSTGMHVAQLMLDRRMIPTLAIVGFILDGTTAILTKTGAVSGLEADEELIDRQFDANLNEIEPYRVRIRNHLHPWPSCYGEIVRVFRPSSHPHIGTRNIHAMASALSGSPATLGSTSNDHP